MRIKAVFASLVMLAGLPIVQAQSAPVPSPTPAPVSNLYGAGLSFNSGAAPQISGTFLYSHLLLGPTDSYNGATYAVTVIDALPASVKPFTVTTNMGAGVAQKIATIGKVPVFIPTAVGISFTGNNTGWQWNTGGLAVVHIKGPYYVMPMVRLVKSSVSGGAGYQPIVGVLFGWGS